MSERDSAFDALKTLISLTDKDADPETSANMLFNAQMSSSLAFNSASLSLGCFVRSSARSVTVMSSPSCPMTTAMSFKV